MNALIKIGTGWYKLRGRTGFLQLTEETIETDVAGVHVKVMVVCGIWVYELKKEFNRSQEIFIKDNRYRYANQDADAWKTLEVATLGTLSKLYKNIKHQLPEKALIAKEMGLNLHSELSS